MPVPMTLSDP